MRTKNTLRFVRDTHISIALTLVCLLAADQTVVAASSLSNVASAETADPQTGNVLRVGAGQQYSTIQAAVNVAQPGDTVLIDNGTYAGFYSARSGTQTQPITIKANGTNVVVNSRNANTSDNINIEPHSYITVSGIISTGALRHCLRAASGTGVIFTNCTTRGGATGILAGYVTSMEVVNCTVSGATNEHGVYVGGTCSNVIYRGITCWGNAKSGLKMNGSGSGGVMKNCLVENCNTFSNAGPGLTLTCVQDSTIRNNLITYNNTGPLFGNAAFNLSREPSATSETGCQGNVLVNNTIIDTYTAGVRFTDSGSTNNVLFNCIIVQPTGNYIADNSGGVNYFASGADTKRTSIASLFVGPPVDFHLAIGSPAVDAGTDLYRGAASPSTDREGTVRPNGTRHDSGTYER